MKVLYSHYLLDDDNPPARIVHAIGRELEALGHEVRIHRSAGSPRPPAPQPQPQPHAGPAGVRPGRGLGALRSKLWFARASGRNLPMFRRDLAAVRAFRPDVVLARQDAYCASMAAACRWTGTPLVTHADAPVAYESRAFPARNRWHPPWLVEAIETWGLAASTLATATSRPTADHLARTNPALEFRVIPNGVDPERFAPLDGAERRRRREALGVREPLVVGFQGTFRAFHGIDRLRDLILATSERTDAHWLLVGDGPERPALQAALAGRPGVTFLGSRPPGEVGALLGLMDVAVAPHQFTRGLFYLSPLKVIEYAAAGCAVVAGNQGDIAWLLDEGRAGVVLDDESIAAWAGAVNALLDDEPRRRALGEAARRHVLNHFSWRRIGELYEEALLAASGEPAHAALAASHENC